LNLASPIGFFIGMGIVLWAAARNGSLRTLVDVGALLLQVGGLLATTMFRFPIKRLRDTYWIVRKSSGKSLDPEGLAKLLLGYGERVRWEGTLALEQEAEVATDPFLKLGLTLLVDGTDADEVRRILEMELGSFEYRTYAGTDVVEFWGQAAPAFGMIGTLIALIGVLKQVGNSGQLALGMGSALLSTFYGLALANFFLVPLAGRLRGWSAQEVRYKEAIIEALVSIQAEDSVQVLAAKLNAVLGVQVNRQVGSRTTEE
jgi:chemotaxis protein MotA